MQEFMIVPVGAQSFGGLAFGSEIFNL